MDDPARQDTPEEATDSPRLTRALRLTRAGIWWEAVARAFWPALTLALLLLAALSMGLVEALPAAMRVYAGGVAGLILLVALIWGVVRFRRPAHGAAERRLDATLPGMPLSAYRDRPALGEGGTLWQAHRAQMAARLEAARPVRPDAELRRRDPFALRLVGLTALAMALLFGSSVQLGQGLAALAPPRDEITGQEPQATGPGWEAWARPPAYTRKPTIYLNDLAEGRSLELPEGSIINLRLYGDDGAVSQNIGPEIPLDDERSREYRVERDGTLTIDDRVFGITVRPDDAPEIAIGAAAERRADGRLMQPFSARDDFGIAAGRAEISLDLDRVDRSYGLALEPEPREVVLIKLPITRNRAEISGQLTADLKKHAWANLPVKIRLHAEDGIGQTAQSETLSMELPGRRFFDPLAAALIELRRDILWSRENAPRAGQLMRAILWQPEGFVDPPMLDDMRAIIAGLETGDLSDAQRDALAEALWRTAVQLEDGGLADALERMRRAQERLSQAMRRGASPDEIRELMDELRRATDEYTDMLAEQGADPASRFDRSPTQTMSGDQIQQMMDEIQRLMNEGRMAEAQELLEQFNRMMENLQVREGTGSEGSGRGSSGRMAETLREQQDLADQAFRQMQDEWMGLDQENQQGEGEGENPGDLADRQSQLRDDLGMQRGLLPERGTQQGDAAGEAMDRAGRAMQEAERALREGDTAGALDRQAEAIEALRDGIRALGQGDQRGEQQQAEGNQGEGEEGQQEGTGRDGEDGRRALKTPRRDPLGRPLQQGSGNGGFATDEDLAEGEDTEGRARELQDEIRRRLGQRDRPQAERDYLDRLIDRF
ncbi:DUF4175 domain-containing protein [Paracoccus sp. SCSIO 75233]|uniref:DUF4175 domain-containing protein n=1 Tax=Paracoccus sp. SCSIO 75233 TaxID=3017782 RepID=UPI0022F05515|nr:DUF4175 family protein [Paracoccus sp. SCSIO 75233]WBU53780.1 DUF4175 family protein [Paracoccus sp. SCSIO 75233]